jgi:hypothetical protein
MTKFLHIAISCLLLAAVAGCEKKKDDPQPKAQKAAPIEESGPWLFQDETDPITDKKTVFGYTISTKGTERLIVACHREQGGQAFEFYVKTSDYFGVESTSVKYRFDKSKPTLSFFWEANNGDLYVGDRTKTVETKSFITQIKSATTFVMQVTDAKGDNLNYFFRVTDAEKMLTRLSGSC